MDTEEKFNRKPETEKIVEVNPIIYYSARADELLVEVFEMERCKLVIKAFTPKIIEVKEVFIADAEINLKWEQSDLGLFFYLPVSILDEKGKESCVLKIRF